MNPHSREDEKSQTAAGPEYVTVQLFEEEVAGASSPFVVPPPLDPESPAAHRPAGAGLTWLAEEEVTTIELNRVALAEALANARSASPAPPAAARSAEGAQTAALVLAAAARILASAAAPGVPVKAAPAAAPRGARWRRGAWLAVTFAGGLGLGALFLGAWGGSFRGWLGRVAEVPFRTPVPSTARTVPDVTPPSAPLPFVPPPGDVPADPGRAEPDPAYAASGPRAPSAAAHRRHKPVVRVDELVLAIPDPPTP